jgi:hypothetical protein
MYASQGLAPFSAHLYRPMTRPRATSSASTASTTSWAAYRPNRCSSSSRSSSTTRSIRAAHPPPALGQTPGYTSSIDGILSRAVNNASSTSLASMSLDSVRAETRPAAFSTLEEREERAQFGSRLEVLEPRPVDTVGWWGVGEVLECEALEASIIE